MRIQYQHSPNAKSGFSEKRRSNSALIELLVVEGAKCRRQAAEGPDQRELSSDEVNRDTEPRLLGKREATLGLGLDLVERIARSEKIGVQLIAAMSGASEIAEFVCRVQCAAHQIATGTDMSGPGKNTASKVHICPGLETRQPAPLDKVKAELAEAIDGAPIIAEGWAGNHGEPYIDAARSVAVAALEAEIDRSAGDQADQVCICIKCRQADLGQNVHCRDGRRVTHQGQLDQRLDRAAPELRPDPLVFAPRLLLRRVRRPVDAKMAKVVKTDGNGTATLIESRIQICAQAGDRGSFHRIGGSA